VPYEAVKARFQQLALRHHPDRIVAESSCSSSSNVNSEEGPSTNDDNKDGSVNEKKQHTSITREQATRQFVRYRQAFEAIAEAGDGSGRAVLRSDADFYNVTANGANNSGIDEPAPPDYDDLSHHRRIDPQVLREVAEVAEQNMAPGGLDKGGMWQFAAAMREKARRGELPPLQVAEGEESRAQSGGKARRRRRRRRR